MPNGIWRHKPRKKESKEMTKKFGWCLTNQHDNCMGTTASNSVSCDCECHLDKDDNTS